MRAFDFVGQAAHTRHSDSDVFASGDVHFVVCASQSKEGVFLADNLPLGRLVYDSMGS